MARQELTPKQARFVDEYLVDLNATVAARRAGYSKKSAEVVGCENLRKPKLHAAITAAKLARSKRTGVTADRVVMELARIAFADPSQVMSWGPDGVKLLDSSALDDGVAATVAEASQTVTKHGGSIRLRLHDKLGALEKLARHLWMYDGDKINVDHTSSDGSMAPTVIRIVGVDREAD